MIWLQFLEAPQSVTNVRKWHTGKADILAMSFKEGRSIFQAMLCLLPVREIKEKRPRSGKTVEAMTANWCTGARFRWMDRGAQICNQQGGHELERAA